MPESVPARSSQGCVPSRLSAQRPAKAPARANTTSSVPAPKAVHTLRRRGCGASLIACKEQGGPILPLTEKACQFKQICYPLRVSPESFSARKARLLVADDEADLLAVMKSALEQEGYEVRTAMDGEQAMAAIREEAPDIAVVDLWMPLKDGFSVCRELKADPEFQHLPIIILSAAGREVENRIEGLESGADDFLTKPFNLGELLARIRMILRRTRQGLDANPLTRLPGNVMIENRITEAVASGRPFAVLYLDLNDFKAYNDRYGYDAGDRVLRATAKLLVEVARETASGDFLGHIGGDDFIIVTHPDRMERLCRFVVERFDRLSPSFYSEVDLAAGKILAHDRRGRLVEHPLLSIAIGVCHNRQRRLASYGQVSQICAELKECAKGVDGPGSRFVIDRRGDKP